MKVDTVRESKDTVYILQRVFDGTVVCKSCGGLLMTGSLFEVAKSRTGSFEPYPICAPCKDGVSNEDVPPAWRTISKEPEA